MNLNKISSLRAALKFSGNCVGKFTDVLIVIFYAWVCQWILPEASCR